MSKTLNRRDFIKTTSATTVGVAAIASGVTLTSFAANDKSVTNAKRWGMLIDTNKLTETEIDGMVGACQKENGWGSEVHSTGNQKPTWIKKLKVQEKKRPLERAFFTVSSYKDYKEKSEQKIKQGVIARKDLEVASIEELAIGTYMNFNFFHTPISNQVDFIGIERRLQTNIHDYNALPAKEQLEMDIDLQNIEVGHTPASIRESLLEKVIKMGDKFVAAVKKEYAPGIIGPFSLQSVITKDLELIVYDVSLRVPGNPIVATTSPYTKYQYGQTFGVGRRIAMEIKRAQEEDRLDEIVT